MKHWWNVVIRENPKYLEEDPSQCRVAHYKSHMNGPRIEPGPPQ